MPSNQINNMKGESSICITNMGSQKLSFTVVLCARASEHKIPAFCVLKELSGRILSRVLSKLVIPKNIQVSVMKNGWIHAETMKELVWKILGPDEDDVSRLLVMVVLRPIVSLGT